MGQYVGKHLEIVETLGRGGMGEVYVARDHRLDRRVALKSIRAERRMSAAAKLRFLREARVLSSLDHPNICRIYDYVEAEDRDYLVLELIEGRTLGQAIVDGLDRASCLRIAEQLAGVLVVAHAAGVVHRDLKPDNVMLTPAGELKVLDFGLARQVGEKREPEPRPEEPSEAAGSDEEATLFLDELETRRDGRTELGQIIGTPMFMSPEQAAGAEVTAASDMYSFGLLLQTLFTGKLPYDSAADLGTLLERVRQGQTRPVRGVDRHLAALIDRLTSLAPTERSTAVQTQERLRWILQKPRRRLRRITIAAMLLIAVLAGAKYTIDLRRERGQAVRARNDAEDLLTFMIGDLRDKLAPVGRLDALDAVGDKALEYFAQLPEGEIDDADLFRRTNALQLIGQVRMAEGDPQAATLAFEESLTLGRDLVARDPGRGEWLAGLGASVFYLGAIALDQGRLDQAEEAFNEYHDMALDLAALDPDNPDWQMELAYAHTNLGAVHQARGQTEQALERFGRSVQIKRDLARARPGDADGSRDVANSLSWLAAAQSRAFENEAALALYEEELEIRSRLLEAEPDNTEARYLLVTCHSHVGKMRVLLDRPGDALEHFRAMRGLTRDLVSIDPENAEWRRLHVASHRQMSRAWRDLDDLRAARQELDAGMKVLHGLAQRDPDHVEWSVMRARFHRDLSSLEALHENWSSVRSEAVAGRTLLQALLAGGNAHPNTRLDIALLELLAGRADDALGDEAAAREAWSRALAAVEDRARSEGDPLFLETVAFALLYLERNDEARPFLLQLETRRKGFPELFRLAEEKRLEIAEDSASGS